jgi:hypothetical protein
MTAQLAANNLFPHLEDQFQVASKGDKCEDEFWFTGQMFDSQWMPRVT